MKTRKTAMTERARRLAYLAAEVKAQRRPLAALVGAVKDASDADLNRVPARHQDTVRRALQVIWSRSSDVLPGGTPDPKTRTYYGWCLVWFVKTREWMVDVMDADARERLTAQLDADDDVRGWRQDGAVIYIDFDEED